MDTFDDFQIEESVGFDFGEQSQELFEEETDSKSFEAFLNSNWDF